MPLQELNARVLQVSADRRFFTNFMKILLHVVEGLKITFSFFFFFQQYLITHKRP